LSEESKAKTTVKVADAGEIENGKGKIVRAGGTTLAIFRIGDEFFALDNFCLHRGGPLGEGELDGYNLTCPWHGWTYDVRTGSFEIIPPLKVRTFPVKREGETILVELDGTKAG
jgi:nitrite reductase/ring-hydroxylating ferredoxin subunit